MRRRILWITTGLAVGLLTLASLGAQAPLFQNVLLHVGTPSSPTALTATNGALNVSINGGAPTGLTSITFATGGAIRTGTTAGNTVLFQGYNTSGTPAYNTLGTITAVNGTPTIAFPVLTGQTSITFTGDAITDAGAGLSVSQGLHVGGTSDPGDNNLLVDGTLTVSGASTSLGATPAAGGGLRMSDGESIGWRSQTTNWVGLRVTSAASPVVQFNGGTVYPQDYQFYTAAATGLRVEAAGATTVTGTLTVSGAMANGQKLGVKAATESLTCSSGATCTTTADLIPAGSMVVGVTTRVTTLITGATSYSIGDGSDVDAWGAGIAVAANTTSGVANFTVTSPGYYTAAKKIVLTAAGSDFTAGVIRITVWYIDLTAATS